jgi:hypothetical protein
MMLVMRWKKHTIKESSQDAVNKDHDMEAEEVDGPTVLALKDAAGEGPVLFELLEPDVYTYSDNTDNVNQDRA